MKTRAQKEQSVTILTEKLNMAKSVTFANYQGWTMKHLSELRKALKATRSELLVTKNTLMERALKDASYPELPADLQAGPTATVFAFDDEVSSIKVLVKAIKDTQMGKVKAGYLNKAFLDGLSVTRLSTLPSKLELQAQTVGLIASPLRGMVSVLQGNLRNLVYAIDQIRQKKGGE